MNIFRKTGVDRKQFLILLLASIFGGICIFPYTCSINLFEFPKPLSLFVTAIVVQIVIMFSIFIFIGLFIGKKIGLGTPIIEDWLNRKPVKEKIKSILFYSIVSGILVGILLFIFDRYVFAFFVEPITVYQAKPPLWQRFFVCFYGGINEEISLRLFLMTLIVWISNKIGRMKNNTPAYVNFWLAIILTSVLFGLGHLPMTAKLMEITPVVIMRAVVLNGIAGIVFGWLYWKKGLESAIISHFSTDIVLHVILPSLY